MGRFAPDLSLVTDDGPVRLAELRRDACPLLLDLGHGGLPAAAAGWRDRVVAVTATADQLTATGLLVRPDGYVAWAAPDRHAAGQDSGLVSALTTWFGSALGGSPELTGEPAERRHGPVRG